MIVKATGEIVEVDFHVETKRGKLFGEVTDSKRLCKPDSTYRKFYRDEIEFLSYEDTPTFSYWEKLKHQYAGMAMQGMLSNAIGFDEVRKQAAESGINNLITLIAGAATDYATALVEKLKEKEERK